jgi:hypothetical protein
VIHSRTFQCHLSLSPVVETTSTAVVDLFLTVSVFIICVIIKVEMLLGFLIRDFF